MKRPPDLQHGLPEQAVGAHEGKIVDIQVDAAIAVGRSLAQLDDQLGNPDKRVTLVLIKEGLSLSRSAQ